MCGIIAYVGSRSAVPILIDGLRRLEYRGYDSAGIAVADCGNVLSIKSVGKIINLESKISGTKISGKLGIAHTRWATHGKPSELNAHPHSDCEEKIWIVHNGIIENYRQLKNELIKKGHKFRSETDSEVVAHLLEENYKGNICEAIQNILPMLKGAYGLVAFHKDEPERLVAARKGSPLVVGLCQDEYIVASDVSAILRYTRDVIFLDDNDVIDINNQNHRIINLKNGESIRESENIDWNQEQAEKNGYEHFTKKEINEQSQVLKDSIRGRIDLENANARLGGLEEIEEKLKDIKRLIIVGCGTAYNAGLVGKYMLEEYAGINVDVEWSSEYRYRKTVTNKETALLAISQSGETADTIAAINEAKTKDMLTLGIVNVVGSAIARLTDAGVYNHIGPEIAVASTKALTSQLGILVLITVLLGRQRQMSFSMGKRILEELMRLPEKQKQVLQDETIIDISSKYADYKSIMFLGRKYNCAIAGEGALKMRELAYIDTLGLASGELKHGSIAMIDEKHLSVVIAPVDSVYEKNKSSIEEIKARGGKVLAVTTIGNNELEDLADDVIYIPKTLELLTPIVSIIPLQLLAYYIAVKKGFDVDQPRNLAKSVTVE